VTRLRNIPKRDAQYPTRGGVCLKPVLKEACSQVYPESAICVQRFDDSLNSAIRITYRISLRSSSLREPRYPLLTVVRVSYSYIHRGKCKISSLYDKGLKKYKEHTADTPVTIYIIPTVEETKETQLDF
jgi:hypothetical protein